ncbi:MAG TPA: S53 family peptidase [Actinocrinis sp.]|jgi:subtilase family serine protease|uniref:S53 family peptidase n=1 Tax=Actinocrinis sp. TaxID=1920516 RepID=UPI002DDCD231|nr:S53 family peptidase [Actinocrinis sp.]HEV3172208.1 S53 family peptidase [Actinocrinis sp.]
MRIHHGSVPALGIGATAVLIALAPTTAANTAAQASAHTTTVKPIPASAGHIDARTLVSPLPTSQCVAQLGIHCYSPLQYRVAFGLNDLYQHHITGQGRTIMIVDSFGSPTIQHDLDTFDAQWGLPATTVQIVQAGVIPPFDPTNSDMLGWAGETSLDVEYAHSIAPGAKIVLVETPVSETEGVQGFPEMMHAEESLIDKGVGDVISQSFGATENTFPGFAQGDFSSLLALRFAFKAAAEHGVTVLASSGDSGATDAELDGSTLYPFRVNSWPSSDPLVTSVGGTQLTLNDTGTRLSPDVVWNDGFGAGGGGLSGVFERPEFQDGVAGVVGDQRGTPDISMPASVDGGAWVYYSFNPARVGWHIIGGTSEASPIFSGIVALADQVAGHRLGNINTALYELGLGKHSEHAGIVDVTSGNNSFAGVTGFSATSGYDLASGWGTIDAPDFVKALAHESEH